MFSRASLEAFSVIVLKLLFLDDFSHGLAPANPNSVVTEDLRGSSYDAVRIASPHQVFTSQNLVHNKVNNSNLNVS